MMVEEVDEDESPHMNIDETDEGTGHRSGL
jgi:hypothetical protein